MPYEEKCEPSQELSYYSLISQCENVIERIAHKTSFIQLQRPLAGTTSKELENGSELEEKLKSLLRKLENLDESYKL